MTPDLGPPRLLLLAAQAAIVLLLAFETWMLARLLSWRVSEARPKFARRTWLAASLIAILFAIPAGLITRSGALAPGVSGAGMPWERTTDDTPILAAAQAGQRAYMNRCAPCHLPEGTGLPPAYPALIGSAVLRGPIATHARVALWGSAELDAGRGHEHAHEPGRARMPAFASAVSDEELAAILTYERLAFAVQGRVPARDGGDADSVRHHVRPSDVARARASGPPR
jgi:mono/diheme cytochrome c family protein